MLTSLVLVHRKPYVNTRFLRVRLPAEVGQGPMDDGYVPCVAEIMPAKKVGVEHHGPDGVTRSIETRPPYVRIGGWHLEINSDRINNTTSGAMLNSRLVLLRPQDVLALDKNDLAIRLAKQELQRLTERREILLAEAVHLGRRATVKDIQP